MDYDDFLKWQEMEEVEDSKPDPSDLYKLTKEKEDEK